MSRLAAAHLRRVARNGPVSTPGLTFSLVGGALVFGALASGLDAQVVPPGSAPQTVTGAGHCRISGRIAHGTTPLPGVALQVRTGDRLVTASSSDVNGEWSVALPPGTFQLVAALTGFDRVERTLTVAGTAAGEGGDAAERREPATTGSACLQTIPLVLALTRPRPPATPSAVPAGTARGGRGFDALAVQATASADAAANDGASDLSLALPPGFSADAIDSVAVNGATARLDRRLLNDRAGTRGRGAGQRLYQGTTSYTMAGSVLDAAPFQLRPESPTTKPDYVRQGADFTVGGPVRIPGVYDGTRRTNVTLSYQASRGDNIFDQYAAVPSAAMRAGDFSTLATTLLDPATGQPFPGNQVPVARLSPSALALLPYIPLPNVADTARNFHHTTTAGATQDNVNVRLQHNFTPPTGVRSSGGPGGGSGGGRGGGTAGGVGGRGRGAQNGTTASLNAQVQYRSSDNDRVSVFPALGGHQRNRSLSVPVTVNVSQRRVQHTISVSVARTDSDTANRFAFGRDVAGEAGIAGVATDPFDWGVPTLAFSSLSSLNDIAPSTRRDTRLSAGYSWSRWMGKRHLRFGGDLRREWSTSRTDANARGSFIFTGLYSGNDFADFLLGAAQQASVQYGPGQVRLRSRSASLYAEHEWWYSYYTLNTGVRYELTGPYTDASGHLVNLDVAPGFSAATPVTAGGTGPYSGTFPDALVATDLNNVMPRIGIARQAGSVTLRAGYGISVNTGSYAGIARQLAGQPPFAVTNTSIGATHSPLPMGSALTAPTSGTHNTYGVARNYALGQVQTWNIDVSRDLTWIWGLSGGYTFARGSGLDLVRAPNRGPDGLRIAGAQPFLWQTADGRSRLHSAVVRLRRRTTRGIGGNLSYTLSRSMDDASSIGGGTVVAQDDQNLAAEWGLSSFDRRHQVTGNVNLELPFGENRKWLNDGGPWARLLEAWTASVSMTVQAGTPLTARVLSAASDVARGTNGTLRANFDGGTTSLDDPIASRFFNTEAFSVPMAGSFGTSARNVIIGPGSRDLSAQVTRDIPLSGTRALSVQLRASNLLNLVNYQAVDTVVNSPTFGQVTSVRPLRSVQLNVRVRF